MKRISSLCLALVISFSLVIPSLAAGINPKSPTDQVKKNTANILLAAEIKSLNNGKIQFVLKAGKKDVEVYQDWNSWGWFARSFTATDKFDSKIKYELFRPRNVWAKNFPSTDKVKAGEVFVTDINLCDGTWSIEPRLKSGKDHYLLLCGHFDIVEEKQKKKLTKEEEKFEKFKNDLYGDSWTGHLDTNAVEIMIPNDCIASLDVQKEIEE